MSAEQNEKTVRRFLELVMAHDLATLDELVAPDCVFHDIAGFGVPTTLEGYRMMMAGFGPGTAGDMKTVIELSFGDGEHVFIRHEATFTHAGQIMGIPATGRRIAIREHHTYRLADGKITDQWVVADMAGMMQQLRATDTPRPREP